MSRRRIVSLTAALALALSAALTSSASATYDQIQIRQIHPSLGVFGGEWVELQMYTSGQNLVTGKVIRTFDPGGNQQSLYVIGAGPGPHPGAPNGQNQRTILISSLFNPVSGVPADFVAPVADLQMTGMDGAVCYTENNPPTYTPIDCVSYGNFTGTLPAGTPAVQTPFESTLERSIAKGCTSALDPADDTNNSAADFALSTRSPRNNATAPTEVPCAPEGVCRGTSATISGTPGNDTLTGTPQADVIAGGAGNDKLSGRGGNDIVCGGSGKDKETGGAGKDTLSGQAGKDRLLGGKGKDRLLGGKGRDVLKGGKGNDKLVGGPGDDKQVQ